MGLKEPQSPSGNSLEGSKRYKLHQRVYQNAKKVKSQGTLILQYQECLSLSPIDSSVCNKFYGEAGNYIISMITLNHLLGIPATFNFDAQLFITFEQYIFAL